MNTRSSIYKEEMRKQNHPIELFIVTNFILMKSTRFHYSGLGHNLCYKETSAVTKFAIMRSAHWRIEGQGWGGDWYAVRSAVSSTSSQRMGHPLVTWYQVMATDELATCV